MAKVDHMEVIRMQPVAATNPSSPFPWMPKPSVNSEGMPGLEWLAQLNQIFLVQRTRIWPRTFAILNNTGEQCYFAIEQDDYQNRNVQCRTFEINVVDANKNVSFFSPIGRSTFANCSVIVDSYENDSSREMLVRILLCLLVWLDGNNDRITTWFGSRIG